MQALKSNVRTLGRTGPHITTSRRVVLRRNFTVKAASEGSTAPAAPVAKTFTVDLSTRKPAGLVFAQKGGQTGPVYVDEVTPDGQADKAGVQVGDVIIRCSAMILKNGMEDKMQQEGYGQRLYNNWEKVAFDCRGQDFKYVMSALKSNNSRMGIADLQITFQRS